MEAQYKKAWALMPEDALEKTANALFVPVFSKKGGFACRLERFDGDIKKWTFMRFDDSGVSAPLFDHKALARLLTEKTGEEYDADRLDLTLESVDENGCRFSSGKEQYCLEDDLLRSLDCGEYCVSPDGKLAVFIHEHDLYICDINTGAKHRITSDGCRHFDYASRPEGDTSFIADKLADKKIRPNVLWSPDNAYFVTYKLDQRDVLDLHLLQSVPDGQDLRPRLHSYKYAMPGDEILPESTFYIYDVKRQLFYATQMPSVQSSTMPPICDLSSMLVWSDLGRTLIAYTLSRDFKTASVYRISPTTGEAARLFDETTDTFHFFDFFNLSQNEDTECPGPNPAPMWYFDDLGELLWLSQRDGRYHLYAYDGYTGELLRQVTKGDFDVCRLHYADISTKLLYLSVIGLQDDPYDRSLISASILGGEINNISYGEGNHLVSFAQDGNCYVDVLTESDTPPQITLHDNTGKEKALLAQCDITRLEPDGLIIPKRFRLTGADGKTTIYGILLLPENAENQKVPLVDYYYGGTQTAIVPHTFYSLLHTGFIESIVQLGIAVLVIDGMGTPCRGKAFHDACYKNQGDCAGIEDHIEVLRQLCRMYPELDSERIGVWGHSGGGYAAFHCLTRHPEVYSCGVSSGGNHSQEIYIADWSERFMGRFEQPLWRDQCAESQVRNLSGKLLLIHGELDDNVHPAHTMRIVNALINADKDFELLLMPNMHHSLRPSRYFRRRILDFFAKNLEVF